MAGEQFKRFIDLVAYDQDAYKTVKTIEKLQHEVSLLARSLAALEERRAKAKLLFDDRKKDVDVLEVSMRELSEQEQEKKARLEEAGDSREYKSLKIEITHLKKDQHDREQALMAAWNAFESAKADFEEKDRFFVQEETEYSQKRFLSNRPLSYDS